MAVDMDYVVDQPEDPVYWVRLGGPDRNGKRLTGDLHTQAEAETRAAELAAERGAPMDVLRLAWGIASRVKVVDPGERGC